jgi:hypothetical protein
VARPGIRPRPARHAAHRAGEEAEAIDDGGDLVIQRRIDRLAAVQRLERGEGSASASIRSAIFSR